MAPQEGPRLRVTSTVAYLAIIAFVLAAYADPILELTTGGWRNTSALSHGYLLLIVAAMELVRRLRSATWSATLYRPWPLLLLGILSLCWFAAKEHDIKTLTQGLVPLIAAVATIAYAGWAQRRLAVPWLLMMFAVPGWSLLTPALQSLAVTAVGAFIKVVGIPAYVDGEYFHLPYGTLEVADGCSGVHQFTIGLLLSVLVCIYNAAPLRRGAWIVVYGAAASLLANWTRIAVLVFVGYETQMQHRWVTVDHYWMGWFVFALIFGSYLLLASRCLNATSARPGVPASTPQIDSASPALMHGVMVTLVAAIGPILSVLL